MNQNNNNNKAMNQNDNINTIKMYKNILKIIC